jgi:hypothetical protein
MQSDRFLIDQTHPNSRSLRIAETYCLTATVDNSCNVPLSLRERGCAYLISGPDVEELPFAVITMRRRGYKVAQWVIKQPSKLTLPQTLPQVI